MDSESVSFRVANDALSGAVSWVAKSLPAKPAQPVLRGILITADDDGLTLAGYDYEVSTEVKISAIVDEPGRIAVAGKLMADITSTLPNKEIQVSYDGSKVTLECGSSRFELPAIPLDDYPELPELPADTGTVNPGLFAEAVTQVASAASRDETLLMLTGVFMEIKGNQMLLASTDRFRMAVRTFTWNCTAGEVDAHFLIPAKTLLDAAKSMDASTGEDIEIAVGASEAEATSAKLFGVRTEGRKTTTRLLDAEFPKFRPLLPKQHTSMATVEISPLLDAVKRVSLVTDRSSSQIRMEFSAGQLVITGGGADAGKAEEIIDCAFVGEPITTAFNTGYLRDGLGAIKTKRAVFGFTQASRPVLVIPEPETMPEADDSGTFPTPETELTYVLMPVRLP
ncbi:DNA polymerase III subunit beta [Corynebacterium mendelii]|uniref:Beta sliding clamp n=1 Tax=Corynebacterium mendelii TaxID=2765362 RepID=A0A939E0R3_9CORY|nr:DNA polymerase III subunit beta [Corynebacterium mendelii]MBN9644309.1 DNA polymerase III subunit beta [Corynebacterium mendelii]